MMSIRETKFSNGERFCLLSDSPYGLPDAWVAGYTVTVLRAAGVATNTVTQTLLAIDKGNDFFRQKGVDDLRARILSQTINDDELSSLADCFSERVGGGPPIVKAGTQYQAFIDYVLWLGAQPSQSPISEDLLLLRLGDLRRRAELLKPVDRDGEDRTARLGLTREQRDLLLRVIIPVAPDNPFGSMAFRNFTMMSMAFVTGMRSGELLGLKIKHLDLRNATGRVAIERSPDDPDDPRRRPAAQKTLSRVVPLCEDLVDACRQLIVERRQFPAARRHPYLIVNCDGAPLSDRGLRKAYQTLRTRHPDLGGLINHQLRHDWNDRWTEMASEKGMDLARALDQQLLAMGWKPGSAMPTRYSRRSRQEAAEAHLIEFQEA